MIFLRLVYILPFLAAISCHASKSNEAPAPDKRKAESENAAIKVTIDGREASPAETQAFGSLGKKLLSDAIPKALNKAVDDMFKTLEVTDPIEKELFSMPVGPENCTGDQLWSIYLVRPGSETQEPRTTVLLREEKPIIRFTRATASVARPIAVMSLTGTKDGKFTQTETLLIYGSDGKWKPNCPAKPKERLKGGNK